MFHPVYGVIIVCIIGTADKKGTDLMLQSLIQTALKEGLISLVLSNPRKSDASHLKYKARPVDLGGETKYQVEAFTKTQSFHENLAESELPQHISNLQHPSLYKQMDIYTAVHDYHILFNKKGEMHVKTAAPTMQPQTLSHNRKKTYILEEGQPVPFLINLGIMTPEGKIISKKYDKFRQINRYLEMVDDILEHLDTTRTLRIIDFGCGKSYLTFALYHYLVFIKKVSVSITGLDLKKDVIQDCSLLAKELKYDQLTFQLGDIAHFSGETEVDMVITLHACDVATDYALHKAVGWKAKVILSVPCCQHELNNQIGCAPLDEIFKYGIIKERTAALFTDAMRANWLELQGYDVQILEFIDIAHTPKNLLIRAVRTGNQAPSYKVEAFAALQQYLGADLTISRL